MMSSQSSVQPATNKDSTEFQESLENAYMLDHNYSVRRKRCVPSESDCFKKAKTMNGNKGTPCFSWLTTSQHKVITEDKCNDTTTLSNTHPNIEPITSCDIDPNDKPNALTTQNMMPEPNVPIGLPIQTLVQHNTMWQPYQQHEYNFAPPCYVYPPPLPQFTVPPPNLLVKSISEETVKMDVADKRKNEDIAKHWGTSAANYDVEEIIITEYAENQDTSKAILLRQENDKLQQESNASAALISKMEQIIESIQNQNERTQEEKMSLEEEMELFESETSKERKIKEDEIQNLQKKIKVLKQERDDFKKTTEILERERKIAKQEKVKEAVSLKKEIWELNRKASKTEDNTKCKIKKLKIEVIEERKTSSLEKEKCVKLAKEKQDLETEMLNYKEMIKSLQAENESEKNDKANLDKENCLLQNEIKHLEQVASETEEKNKLEIINLKSKINEEWQKTRKEIEKSSKLDILNKWLENEMKKYKETIISFECEIKRVKRVNINLTDEKILFHKEIDELKLLATQCADNKKIEVLQFENLMDEEKNRRLENEEEITKLKEKIESLENENIKMKGVKSALSDKVVKEKVGDVNTAGENKVGEASSSKLSKLEKKKIKLISDLEDKILEYNNDRSCETCGDKINCENCWKYINKFHQVFYSYCATKYAEKLKISMEEAQNIFLTTATKTISRFVVTPSS